MRAAFYDQQGDADDVLQLGELPDPSPEPGEVVVQLSHSGVNPGDVKKRQGWLGSTMPFPRVIPHSDGAGTIVATGAGVPAARVGERVWVWGAQSYRAFGTAAGACAVPADQAVALPATVPDQLGACLGIPGITAHRAVFVDGDPRGTMLVHGVTGAVASLAAQLARSAGVTVIGTVRSASAAPRAEHLVDHVVTLDPADTEGTAHVIRDLAPGGVSRIIEVALSANADLDAAVIAPDGVIAAYATVTDPAPLPFWRLLFANVTIRLLGSDDFPREARRRAAAHLTRLAAAGALRVDVGTVLPLDAIAAGHHRVEQGGGGRVLLSLN